MMNNSMNGEEIYSFHLSDESVYSDTDSVSSSCKQRIDSLFSEKKRDLQILNMSDDSDIYSTISDISEPSFHLRPTGPNGISNGLAELLAGRKGLSNGLKGMSNGILEPPSDFKTSRSSVNNENSFNINNKIFRTASNVSKPTYHLGEFDSSALARRELPKIPTKNNDINLIKNSPKIRNEEISQKQTEIPHSNIKNMNSWSNNQSLKSTGITSFRSTHNNVQEEIEEMFGGRDERRKSFRDVRSKMQEKIDMLFADASGETEKPRVGTIRTVADIKQIRSTHSVTGNQPRQEINEIPKKSTNTSIVNHTKEISNQSHFKQLSNNSKDLRFTNNGSKPNLRLTKARAPSPPRSKPSSPATTLVRSPTKIEANLGNRSPSSPPNNSELSNPSEKTPKQRATSPQREELNYNTKSMTSSLTKSSPMRVTGTLSRSSDTSSTKPISIPTSRSTSVPPDIIDNSTLQRATLMPSNRSTSVSPSRSSNMSHLRQRLPDIMDKSTSQENTSTPSDRSSSVSPTRSSNMSHLRQNAVSPSRSPTTTLARSRDTSISPTRSSNMSHLRQKAVSPSRSQTTTLAQSRDTSMSPTRSSNMSHLRQKAVSPSRSPTTTLARSRDTSMSPTRSSNMSHLRPRGVSPTRSPLTTLTRPTDTSQRTVSSSPSRNREVSNTRASESSESIPRTFISTMSYGVDYLGFIPIQSTKTSLEMVQEPLKDLYYEYRFSLNNGHKPMPGRIQLNESGLNIAYGHSVEQVSNYSTTYPFQNIAIWAAIKLVIRKQLGEHGAMHYSYAFLPLISDPDQKDKFNLYNPLTVADPTVMNGAHPPMFSCITRKKSNPSILECHGFVCRSTEDAVIIAANLYQSVQITSSREMKKEPNKPIENPRIVMSDSETDSSLPVRPPRRKRTSSQSEDSPFNSTERMGRSKSQPGDSPFNSTERMVRSKSQDFRQANIITNDNIRGSKRQIRRSHSDRQLGPVIVDSDSSYSNGSLRKSKSLVHIQNDYNLQDFLQEVRQKTGMRTVNDVLKQAIHPKGMSFSEMDPDKREILLRLATTLSKDEIYKYSKNIMKKQKAKSYSNLIESDSESSSISSVFKATKRSLSRLGSRASSVHNIYKTDRSPLKKFMSNRNQYSFDGSRNSNEEMHKRMASKNPGKNRSHGHGEGYVSCSDCGYESERYDKCHCATKQTNRLTNHGKVQTATLTNNSNKVRIHSSYCNCEAESSAESEICYCSLNTIKRNARRLAETNHDSETDTSNGSLIYGHKKGYNSYSNLSDIVSSDSDTWKRTSDNSRSNTLRSRGSSSGISDKSRIHSSGSVFTVDPYPTRGRRISSNMSLDSDTSSGGSGYHSQEVEMPKRIQSPQHFPSAESIYKARKLRQLQAKAKLDEDSVSSSNESSISKGTHRPYRSQEISTPQQKVLLVSACDTNGKLVYQGASKQDQQLENTSSIISMKKTAEIAALFTDMKLNQTTDMINALNSLPTSDDSLDDSLDESEDENFSTTQTNGSFLFSDDMQNSLGFLP
ncbi:unnamed protein product [Meganyctiphanes norvegica]|uniref:PID domain-containing protein n=1 Tax=Meganyctiphanes norvegica TaxID=48144 RepID=A0AAV2SJ36_MEGNR